VPHTTVVPDDPRFWTRMVRRAPGWYVPRAVLPRLLLGAHGGALRRGTDEPHVDGGDRRDLHRREELEPWSGAHPRCGQRGSGVWCRRDRRPRAAQHVRLRTERGHDDERVAAQFSLARCQPCPSAPADHCAPGVTNGHSSDSTDLRPPRMESTVASVELFAGVTWQNSNHLAAVPRAPIRPGTTSSAEPGARIASLRLLVDGFYLIGA